LVYALLVRGLPAKATIALHATSRDGGSVADKALSLPTGKFNSGPLIHSVAGAAAPELRRGLSAEHEVNETVDDISTYIARSNESRMQLDCSKADKPARGAELPQVGKRALTLTEHGQATKLQRARTGVAPDRSPSADNQIEIEAASEQTQAKTFGQRQPRWSHSECATI
jgi:hypothetical protein